MATIPPTFSGAPGPHWGGKTTTGFSAESLFVSAVSPVFDFSASALGSYGVSGADTGVVTPQPARTRLSNKTAPRAAQRPRINEIVMIFLPLWEISGSRCLQPGICNPDDVYVTPERGRATVDPLGRSTLRDGGFDRGPKHYGLRAKTGPETKPEL